MAILYSVDLQSRSEIPCERMINIQANQQERSPRTVAWLREPLAGSRPVGVIMRLDALDNRQPGTLRIRFPPKATKVERRSRFTHCPTTRLGNFEHGYDVPPSPRLTRRCDLPPPCSRLRR
jgi:hypothetical protein